MPRTSRVCLSSICSGTFEQALAMLASAVPYVDEALIVVAPGDLPELVEPGMKLPVPTTRVEHPWQGYAKTRTIALREAEQRAEWVLTLDDDDRYRPGGILPPMDDPSVGAYTLPVDAGGGMTFHRPHLTRRGLGWRFEGCGSSGLHEALCRDVDVEPRAEVRAWDDLVYVSSVPRATAERYAEHARLLRAALDEDPANTRTAFYLAQSLRDAANLLGERGGQDRAQLGAALAAYVHRGNMSGGFSEETFWSWMESGRLAWRLGLPWEACLAFFAYAQTWGPYRAEPLVDLARLFEAWGKPDLARDMRASAARLPYPKDARLFVEPVYARGADGADGARA